MYRVEGGGVRPAAGTEVVRVCETAEQAARKHAANLAVAASSGAVPAWPALGDGQQPSGGSRRRGLRTPVAPRSSQWPPRLAPVNLAGARKMALAGSRRPREPPPPGAAVSAVTAAAPVGRCQPRRREQSCVLSFGSLRTLRMVPLRRVRIQPTSDSVLHMASGLRFWVQHPFSVPFCLKAVRECLLRGLTLNFEEFT